MNTIEQATAPGIEDFSLAIRLVDAELEARVEALGDGSDTKTTLAIAHTALQFDTRTRYTESARFGRVKRLGNIATLFDECDDEHCYEKSVKQLVEIYT